MAASPASAGSMSVEEIFQWVKSEYKCKKDHPIPDVRFVSKEELQKVYRRCNENVAKKWAGKYGTQKANEMMNFYLNEVIGLCIPKTGDIYVGNFLPPCRRDATVAHELTHYFQIMEDGPIDLKSNGAQDKFLYHEMQAALFENNFREIFCAASDRE
jgi:hypothetical protein